MIDETAEEEKPRKEGSKKTRGKENLSKANMSNLKGALGRTEKETPPSADDESQLKGLPALSNHRCFS